MKKTPIEEPLHYYERKPIITIVCWIIAVITCYWVYDSVFNQDDLRTIHPLSFFSVVPASILLYQALWFTVNPFAIFYKDRLEIKKSLFHHKQWYFLDIKKVNEVNKDAFSITYNDDELEKLNLLGIRGKHIKPLRETLHKFVYESLVKRDNTDSK